MGSEKRLAVIGLGYVGLPLAVAKHFDVLGYDSNPVRIDELRKGHDRIASVTPAALAATKLEVSADEKALDGADIFFVAVPTVLDAKRNPDLSAVKRVTALVAHHIKRGGVFVLESSVAPETTETVCAPILAAGQMVPNIDPEKADDPMVFVAMQVQPRKGAAFAAQGIYRVPKHKLGALAIGRRISVSYLPGQPQSATIDWTRV